jgi:hypothetical protein
VSRALVDLARTLAPPPERSPFHVGIVGSVQAASLTLSSLDASTVTLPGVPWVGAAPVATAKVLLARVGGRLVCLGTFST